MTTPSTARKAGPFNGTGAQTSFPFTFKVFAAGDVKVAIANSAGVETVLTLGTHYSVALNSNQETSPGGTITYPISGSPLPTGSVLSVIGNLPYDQPLDLPSGGNYSPLALENQLDRTVIQVQQLKELVDRAAKLPQTSTETPDELVFNITRLAESADNLDAVAASLTSVEAVAADIADVNTVASNIGNVAATGANIAAVVTVANDLNEPVSEIETVAGSITNVNTVGSNIANVNAVATNMADVATVADNMTDVATVADNVADVTNFADVYYGPSATDPALRRDGSALQNGDLYFNTGAKRMRVFDGAAWVEGSVNAGTITVQRFSGDGTTTAFTLSADPVSENNTQVYIGGVYQQKDQYSVSGTTLTFSAAPPAGTDNIEVLVTATLALGTTTADLVANQNGGTVQEFIDAAETRLFPIYAASVSSAASAAQNKAALQSAIDACSAAGGGTVVLKAGTGTVVTTPLAPKPGVIIDLQGNTLKLADAQNGPLIFDGRTDGPVYERFGVVNGTLDCSMLTNNTSNITGGAIWLTHWDRLHFANLKVTQAYRSIFQLLGCQIVKIDAVDCYGNGITGNARFSYGGEFATSTPAARPCKALKITNFSMRDSWGFGIHLWGADGFDVENLFFSNLSYTSNTAIAITGTSAKNGTIRNSIATNVNGDTYEFNACNDVKAYNLTTVSPGRYGLITGDNGTGVYNERLTIDGLKVSGTGHGTFSLTLNWMKNCEVRNFDVDKGLNTLTTGGPATDRNNLLSNGKFGVNTSGLATRYRKFNFERVAFANFFIARLDGHVASVTCPQVSNQYEISIANGSAAYIELDDLFGSDLNWRGHISGRLRTDTWLPAVSATQSSYQEVPFVASNNGSTTNLGTAVRVDNAVARALTITADAANRRLVLTNATGNDVVCTWAIDLIGV